MTGRSLSGFVKSAVGVLLTAVSGCGFSSLGPSGIGPKVVLSGGIETSAASDGDVKVITYTLANQGDADLKLGTIVTSCGCLSASISSERVEPGKTAEMVIESHPPEVGARNVHMEVATNDPRVPKLKLVWKLVADPKPPKLLTAEPTINLGILRPGEVPPVQTVAFDLLESREPSIIVRLAAVDEEVCDLEGGVVGQSSTEDPRYVKRSHRYSLKFLKAPDIGSFARRIEMFRSDDQSTPWQTIPIKGFVQPIVRAVPSLVRFSKKSRDGKISTRLMIVCADDSDRLAAECIFHDPRITPRIIGREADRIIYELELERTNRDVAKELRPLQFRIRQPIVTLVEVAVDGS